MRRWRRQGRRPRWGGGVLPAVAKRLGVLLAPTARRALRRVGQQPDRVEGAQAAEVRGGAARKGVVPEGSEQVAARHEGLRPDRPRRGAALSQARGKHKHGRHERVVRHPSRRLRVDAVAHGSARRRAAVAPTPLDDSWTEAATPAAAQRARARVSSIWLSGSAQIAPEQAKGQPSWIAQSYAKLAAQGKGQTRRGLPSKTAGQKAPALKSAKGQKGSPKRRTSRG